MTPAGPDTATVRHAGRAAGFAILGLALSMGSPAASRDRSDTAITFRAEGVDRLEIVERGASVERLGQVTRRAVSDVVVRFRPWAGRSLETALAAPLSTRYSATATQFAAELIVVAAGRIHLEDRAACGDWVGDIAICRTECEGGAFAISRRRLGSEPEFSLLLGRLKAMADAGFGETVKLGACADDDKPSALAVAGGRDALELTLKPR